MALAGDFVVSNFAAGLDTLDTPAELNPAAAQDILNVNIQPGGGSIFKRDGYGLFQSLGSGQAVHGGYHFQQVGGNDVQLWGSSTTLYSSVNDATFVSVATGTLNATWQCADSQGSAYCLDSSRDTGVKTDGSSANTSYQAGIPLGTMLAFTPTQLVVGGVSGNENVVYISQQNAFTTFVIGTLPSSAFTEPIASPGSRITHLAYYFGKLFWWKDQSFGYATFTNQFDWQLTIVSNQIGTLDNSDAFWNSSGFDSGAKFTGLASANAGQSPGGIFFRGQDNHFYVYDGYYLTRLSRPITPTVIAANRKKANSWTQTTQADFNNGSIVPAANLSTTISPGDVIVSSFQAVENSSTQWKNGSQTNFSIGISSLSLLTNNSGNLTNPDFESSFTGNWTETDSGSGNRCVWAQQTSLVANDCTISPQHGSNFAGCNNGGINNLDTGGFGFNIMVNGIAVSTTTFSTFTDCVWRQITITDTADVGKRVTFRLEQYDVPNGIWGLLSTSDSYIWSGSLTLYYASDVPGINRVKALAIDNIQTGSSTITSGSFTSQVYNTGFTSSTYQIQSAFTANTSTPTFNLQTSASSSGPWYVLLTSTGTNAIGNQYAMYTTTISVGSGYSALTSITNVTILAQSTGTYYSAVDNAPNLTNWGNFTADDIYPGISSITYFTRASTGIFTVLSSTPAWVPQMKNGVVSASTGTYMQMRGDFYLSAATETPTLNDFTFNWFEGSASDKAYMTYFNDAIWFSVSSSSSVATNNRIFYWDLLNGAWTIYDIPANGFQIENNALYFGSPTTANIFKFGGVTTDNSLPINSYWRSKTFFSPTVLNPYNPPSFEDAWDQKEFVQADFILGESSTTLTYTYTLDSKTSTAFGMTAFDSAASLIQRNFLLPIGKIGKYYDFKVGDNSSAQPWRMMAHRVHYNPLYWKPVLN